MSLNQRSPIDARRSLILDVSNVSQYVEASLQLILNPPPAGVYLPHQLKPVLEQGKPYWYEVPRIDSNCITPQRFFTYDYTAVSKLEEVPKMPWDVVDKPDGVGRVVLPHHLSKNACLYPTTPYHGANIVLEMIDNDIKSTRAYAAERSLRVEEIILPYVQQQYQVLEHLQENPQIQAMVSNVFESMLDILRPVRDFLRSNAYQMCELHIEDLQCVRIDQLGDYRIAEWERHQVNGSWK